MTDGYKKLVCRHFGAAGKLAKPSYTIFSYTVGGFQNWKKAHYSDGGFPQHSKCDYHVDAMVAWADFEKMKASGLGNVRQMQSEACAKIIRQNRHYVKTG